MASKYLSKVGLKTATSDNRRPACSQTAVQYPHHTFILSNLEVEEYRCGCVQYRTKNVSESLTLSCNLHNVIWPRSSQLPQPLDHIRLEQAVRRSEKLKYQAPRIGRPRSNSDPTHMKATMGAFLAKVEGLPCRLQPSTSNVHTDSITSHCQS